MVIKQLYLTDIICKNTQPKLCVLFQAQQLIKNMCLIHRDFRLKPEFYVQRGSVDRISIEF